MDMKGNNFTGAPIIAALLVFTLLAFGTQALAEEAYRLGPGDVINVQVFGEDDLTRELKLGEDGRINYAFVGQIRLQGMTLLEVEQEITDKLKGDYLVNPQVSVTMAEYRPFFISGEVKSPGGFPYQPGLTVSRAIALAGGLTERASERKIFLVSEGTGEQDRRRVDLDAPVNPGDAITVEASFF
ncbi:MAG: polysaccharide biosynthesis/export family protein [Lysobacterales bacterium]